MMKTVNLPGGVYFHACIILYKDKVEMEKFDMKLNVHFATHSFPQSILSALNIFKQLY